MTTAPINNDLYCGIGHCFFEIVHVLVSLVNHIVLQHFIKFILDFTKFKMEIEFLQKLKAGYIRRG